MRILFAGTPEFAVAPLMALHQQYEIAAVFTQPDRPSGRGKKLTPPPVKVAAQARDIEVYQLSSLRDQGALIESLEVDIMVVVAYGMLLPQAVLDLPRIACINIHASLLPRWRGAAPIQRAIQAGDEKTGVSIMRMELGLDTGPVFQMLETPIEVTDTSATLHDKLATLGAQGIVETVAALTKNPNLEAQPQDHQHANYAHKISKAEAQLDWHDSAQQLGQNIRAFNPWPICETYLGSDRIRIWQAQAIDTQHHAQAGEIISLDSQTIVVACGSGALALQTLQRPGSKPLGVGEFCNGFALAVGDKFEASAAQNG